MKKILIVLIGFFWMQNMHAQGVSSPESYLGYPLGSKFTRHHKIVEYFKTVATQAASMVKIESYGYTNEGRELILAFVSTPENIANLEAIRKNNLRLAGLEKEGTINEAAPAIVWLSYNVHGNESSSSEASMLTLFELVNPANKTTKEWLKNTVVVMDPCINPDGRDRYANWYNSMVGKQFNIDPQAREHAEPWPGGRSNHYNFDLNRDWAWQTQIESQQRLQKYNQWMPQIHVDFHEQGMNEPYYFAPAAEPLHDVITPWQREFQNTIGKNHAKYFDANGWLYFTKERFDLLYPSYGDTYPTYNGAIGMTYEQGGGGRAGLAIMNEDGDTLSLRDRLMHHHTTGLSTVEIASLNARKLISEFKSYFDNNRNGKIGDYKTYVLTTKDENKLRNIIALLEKNGIEYGTISNKNFKGLNYASQKEENYIDEGYHLAISAFQPRATMVKVLLEPKTFVSDSNTYDITAWALPYVYGVKGYAVREKLEVKQGWAKPDVYTTVSSDYGLLIPYQSLNSAKALAWLIKHQVKVRFAEKPFSVANKKYDRGTLIVVKTGNHADWLALTNQACAKFNLKPEPVQTGFMQSGADFGSSDVKIISKPIKIAAFTGEQVSSLGAGEIWHFFEQDLDYPITLLNANDINRVELKRYDVIIMPDGNYRNLNDKLIADKLKDYVRNGGKLVALENAVAQMAAGDWGIKAKDYKDADKGEGYQAVKKYDDRVKEYLTNSIPGAIYKVELDVTHPLAFGLGDTYYTLKQDANLYEFLKDGWNVGIIKKENYVAGFAGVKVKEKLKDGTLIGVQQQGAGTIVYLADDPIFRQFWENGKLLLANAIFFAGR